MADLPIISNRTNQFFENYQKGNTVCILTKGASGLVVTDFDEIWDGYR